MRSNQYEVIIIGAGAMGAAASWHLARRGYKILALEQFDIPHELGSHAGQSRIIRKAYFEHSDYVPLLERAYHNWRELEASTSSQVYYKTGLVYFGNPGATLIKGTQKSAQQYSIPLEVMSSKKLMSQYAMFNCPSDYQVLLEPDAGFVTPEKAVALYLSDAIRHNAGVRAREQVTGWKKEGTGITVTTTKNIFHADHLIITAGAWTEKVIPSLPATLKVTKQIVAWMKPQNWDDYLLGNFPCWFLSDEDETLFYGFPILPAKDFGGPVGLKLAMHKHGEVVDPDHMERGIQQQDEEILRSILEKYIPGAAGNVLALKSCLYTNTRDEDFIVDYLPGYDNMITIACGFSGHGFKFASVVGEILADLAVAGKTDLPVEFLGLNRFTGYQG